jgi:rhodanese-related sulfurtransferase
MLVMNMIQTNHKESRKLQSAQRLSDQLKTIDAGYGSYCCVHFLIYWLLHIANHFSQVAIYHLPGAVRIPFEQLESRMPEVLGLLPKLGGSSAFDATGELLALQARRQQRNQVGATSDFADARADGDTPESCRALGPALQTGSGEMHGRWPLIVLCRRGNNSQRVVTRLRQLHGAEEGSVVDVIGGVDEWIRSVEPQLPLL